jgi:hypothetical protein
MLLVFCVHTVVLVLIYKYLYTRKARIGQLNRTARPGHPILDGQNKQAEWDRQNRKGRTGWAELDRQNRTGRTGKAELDRQNWIGRTGQAELDRQNWTGRHGQS